MQTDWGTSAIKILIFMNIWHITTNINQPHMFKTNSARVTDNKNLENQHSAITMLYAPFKIHNSAFCICVFHVILRMNSDHFLKQHLPVDLWNGEVLCFLCGTAWILKYYSEELRPQRVNISDWKDWLILPRKLLNN
jgi:hypothetical protein